MSDEQELSKLFIRVFKRAFSKRYAWVWWSWTVFNVCLIGYVVYLNSTNEAVVCCCACDFSDTSCFMGSVGGIKTGKYLLVRRWDFMGSCADLCAAEGYHLETEITLVEYNELIRQHNSYLVNHGLGGVIN